MKEQLAVSLFDLDRLFPALREKLIQGKVDISKPVKVCGDAAVLFTCDLLTAALVCDMLRSNDRQLGDPPTRLYLNRGESWSRLPFGAVLTLLESSGKAKLSPEFFSSEEVTLIPLPIESAVH